MTRKLTGFILFCGILAALFSRAVLAETVTYISVPNDFKTIEEAVDAIKNEKTALRDILVEPGRYETNLEIGLTSTKKSFDITLRGRETSRTFLIAKNQQNPALQISGAPGTVNIRNFSFISSRYAIKIVDSKTVAIENNVFFTGENNHALLIDASSPVKVINNTFYKNGYAIDAAGNEVVTVTNNIFVLNKFVTNHVETVKPLVNSCFLDNNENERGQLFVAADPAFVKKPASSDFQAGDFHLRVGSPCIDKGTADIKDANDGSPSDIGAFGGVSQDGYLMPVTFDLGDPVSMGGTKYKVSVDWTAGKNESYLVADPSKLGYYKVYYDKQKILPFSDAKKPSSIDVKNGETKIDVTDIEFDQASIRSPKLISVKPYNSALEVTWEAVDGATSYTLSYGKESAREHPIENITGTTYTITGLENDSAYLVSVEAKKNFIYYFYVKVFSADNKYQSYDDLGLESELKTDQSVRSSPSNVSVGIPEKALPYPNLPNEGCFIATAAFGYYSAPEVQILRQFRDQVLLPNVVGHWFVETYYRYSPPIADSIRDREWIKSIVRVALWPLIRGTEVILSHSRAVLFGVVSFALVLLIVAIRLFTRKVSWGRLS